MAFPAHRSCFWMLLVGTCVSLVVGTDCGKECALCVYRLLGQQVASSTSTCSVECDGELDSEKLRLCWDILMEESNRVPFDGNRQEEAEAAGVVPTNDGDANSPEHQLAKKYGGFMKRYGGFMSRRSFPEESLDDSVNDDREEKVRLEILKILNTASQHGDRVDLGEGRALKRYGGFLRRADDDGEVRGDLLEAVLGRGLRKRYGGFMRRVGRPEWLVDGNKNGGVSKRAWENGQQQKRYGGFMD
ncbi:proenkephalin a [Corythoichthys intestinalis]|uniref:proenkephalin a n=1 Tax=Corythoichthys intestinalis TaxID=161448 RepID=UPI0025A607B7|nr:proenkephalin a [Corythoichthys intestinalis]XP_061794820.1 proenkephalin-A-like [Nerophis lumbriciformis]